MDGIAVRSNDTLGASEQSPVRLPVANVSHRNVVPREYDSVIMIEDVWAEGTISPSGTRQPLAAHTSCR